MKGFTLLEILLALGIVAILSFFGVVSLSNFNKDKALSIETEKVLSLISKARSFTLSGRDESAYGIHFEERKIVLFKGPTYSSEAEGNEAQTLNAEVALSGISLSGGSSEVLFEKLSGTTFQSGTVTLASVRDASRTKTVTIAGTGMAYTE